MVMMRRRKKSVNGSKMLNGYGNRCGSGHDCSEDHQVRMKKMKKMKKSIDGCTVQDARMAQMDKLSMLEVRVFLMSMLYDGKLI